jgi:hypothetical protein
LLHFGISYDLSPPKAHWCLLFLLSFPCVCVCVVQFIVTKGSSLIMFSYCHALKILNHHERKLHLEFGNPKSIQHEEIIMFSSTPPPFHQQKLGPEISSLGHKTCVRAFYLDFDGGQHFYLFSITRTIGLLKIS